MAKTLSISQARIKYFFKETFRAHSRAEYREIFSRGLNEDNSGITGTYPWLYVRAFVALFILFAVNTVILRCTGNSLYVPSVVIFGGLTFIVPFMVLLYEIYPKRNLNILKLFAILILGGTASGVLSQLFYSLITVKSLWLSAFVSGLVEEVCKAIPALLAIKITKNKDPFACFLIAAAVGAGFSISEDMGYIFYYANTSYYSDISLLVAQFFNRGLSTFCTHILWTGAVGWAYSLRGRPYKSVWMGMLLCTILVHTSWNLPFEGWVQAVDIALCAMLTIFVCIVILRKSQLSTLEAEVDLTHYNDRIIKEAKELGERMRFTNAANLTLTLMCTLLSFIALLLCCLPIGTEFATVNYSDKQQFIESIEGGHTLKSDWARPYDENGDNVEIRIIENVPSYVIQCDTVEGYEGEYYYGYYMSDKSAPDSIFVELDDIAGRIPCVEYTFGDKSEWVFEVEGDSFKSYKYNTDGSVTAVTYAEEFEGYNILIALVATAVAISGACGVILFAFILKLRRVRDER